MAILLPGGKLDVLVQLNFFLEHKGLAFYPEPILPSIIDGSTFWHRQVLFLVACGHFGKYLAELDEEQV